MVGKDGGIGPGNLASVLFGDGFVGHAPAHPDTAPAVPGLIW